MNSLLAREILVEWTSGGHLHHQHERFSLTESNHAHDERITQLMHNLGLSHHFLLYWFFILILQHFNSHINLFATQQKETWAYEVNLFWRNFTKMKLSHICILFTLCTHLSILKTPFLTQPKLPEPSSTSSIMSLSLLMNRDFFLHSFGSSYGLTNASWSIGKDGRELGTGGTSQQM